VSVARVDSTFFFRVAVDLVFVMVSAPYSEVLSSMAIIELPWPMNNAGMRLDIVF